MACEQITNFIFGKNAFHFLLTNGEEEEIRLIRGWSILKSRMNNNWIFTVNNEDNFHESFKKELGIQLLEKGDETGIKNFKKYEFQIGLGLIPLDLKIKDNRVYGKIDFITPTSFGFPVTITWKLKNNRIPLEQIHQSQIKPEEIDFSWTTDFPLEKIQEHLLPYRKTKKTKNGFGFDVEYFHNLFPDIELEIVIKNKLSRSTIKQLNEALSEFWEKWNNQKKGKEIELISEITTENNQLKIIFDFGLNNTNRILKNVLDVINLNCDNNIEIIRIK